MNIIDDKLRKISFLSGEDFYFLTYLILLCLKYFGSKNDSVFSDHRKITYLMQVICNSSVVHVLIHNINRGQINIVDKELLFDSFTKAALHQREVYKILRALEIKGIVELVSTNSADVYNVKLLETETSRDFFETNIFYQELENIKKIKATFKRINTLGLDGFIKKFFSDYGLNIWAY